jgi:uncharacterized protein YvpB
MWTLFIISFVADFDEYKVTKFNSYITSQQCEINKAVLEKTFTEDEKVVCVHE